MIVQSQMQSGGRSSTTPSSLMETGARGTRPSELPTGSTHRWRVLSGGAPDSLSLGLASGARRLRRLSIQRRGAFQGGSGVNAARRSRGSKREMSFQGILSSNPSSAETRNAGFPAGGFAGLSNPYAFSANSETEWGACPPRALFSAPSWKTSGALHCSTSQPVVGARTGRTRGRVQRRPGRACSPASAHRFGVGSAGSLLAPLGDSPSGTSPAFGCIGGRSYTTPSSLMETGARGTRPSELPTGSTHRWRVLSGGAPDNSSPNPSGIQENAGFGGPRALPTQGWSPRQLSPQKNTRNTRARTSFFAISALFCGRHRWSACQPVLGSSVVQPLLRDESSTTIGSRDGSDGPGHGAPGLHLQQFCGP